MHLIKKTIIMIFLIGLFTIAFTQNLYFDIGGGISYPTHRYQFPNMTYNINEVWEGRLGWELGMRVGTAPFLDDRLIIAGEYLWLRRNTYVSDLHPDHFAEHRSSNHFIGIGPIFYLSPVFQVGASIGPTIFTMSGSYKLSCDCCGDIEDSFHVRYDIGLGLNVTVARNIPITDRHNILIGARYFQTRNNFQYDEDSLSMTMLTNTVSLFVRYAFR